MLASPYTAGELGVLIGQVAAGLGVLIAAIGSVMAARRAGVAATTVTAVHQEVKTINGLALGQLADAAETRRIEKKVPDERTTAETAHIAAVPPPADV